MFTAPGRGGFAAVASRKIGGAVERNRAKRILRAAWREMASADIGVAEVVGVADVVVVAREGIRGVKTQDLVAEMTESLLARARA